jgi:hypothetical protein
MPAGGASLKWRGVSLSSRWLRWDFTVGHSAAMML